MKNLTLIILVVLFITACKSQHEEALKSADKELILKVANEHFAKKKWAKALELYERSLNLVAGTDDLPNVAFNMAYCNYYDKNYKLAGHQFKNFALNHNSDPRKEEAAYMSALCYYEGSMDYNLDQTNTELAINELQNFLNDYPNSERSKNINDLVDELSYKLEFKAYENTRQYYKMGDYKAAIVALENLLEAYPATKLKGKIYEYKLYSWQELAMQSRYDLKADRLESAIAFTKTVEKEMPNTELAKKATEIRSKLEKEKVNFAKVQKEFEAQKADFIEKIKREEEIMAAEQARKTAKSARRDSAKLAVPPSSISLPISK